MTKRRFKSSVRDFMLRLGLPDCGNVKWDRFVEGKTTAGLDFIEVYGWIKREKDKYKDFVSLSLYSDGKNGSYLTSSAKYSLPIYKALNRGVGMGHRKCIRVEHRFRIKNSIKLKK